jgi:SAM-dependent methyltransferase
MWDRQGEQVLEIRRRVVRVFEEYSPRTWWGDHFDVRFYIASTLEQLHGQRILDICCGSGILDYFVPADNELVGIDINEDYIRIARQLNKGKEYFVTDFLKFSYDKKFTVVLAPHAIQEFPKQSQEGFLGKALSFLDTDGRLVLTTPNSEYGSYRGAETKLSFDDLDELLSKRGLAYKIYGYNPMKTRRYPSDRMLSKFPPIANKVDSKLYEGELARKCKSFYVECRLS